MTAKRIIEVKTAGATINQLIASGLVNLSVSKLVCRTAGRFPLPLRAPARSTATPESMCATLFPGGQVMTLPYAPRCRCPSAFNRRMIFARACTGENDSEPSRNEGTRPTRDADYPPPLKRASFNLFRAPARTPRCGRWSQKTQTYREYSAQMR